MRLLPAILICLLAASACRRDKDTQPRQPALDTWVIGDSVYRKTTTLWTGGLSYRTDTVLYIFDRDTSVSGPTLELTFGDTPKAGTDYRVVGTGMADSALEVSITAREALGLRYVTSEDALGGTVQVRSLNGKLVFIASDVRLEYNGFMGTRLYDCSFNITE